MASPTITYGLAMAAAQDAGNRHMRAGRRTKWAVSTKEVAEKIVRENAMTNRGATRLIDAIDEALRNERKRCARIARDHNESHAEA